eukprot:981903-Amphidinium_carterae.1
MGLRYCRSRQCDLMAASRRVRGHRWRVARRRMELSVGRLPKGAEKAHKGFEPKGIFKNLNNGFHRKCFWSMTLVRYFKA